MSFPFCYPHTHRTLPYNTCLRIHTRCRAASAADDAAASAAVVTVGVAIIAFVRFLLYSSVRLQFVFVILKFSRFLCCVPLCSCVWHLFRIRVCMCVRMCMCTCVFVRVLSLCYSLWLNVHWTQLVSVFYLLMFPASFMCEMMLRKKRRLRSNNLIV